MKEKLFFCFSSLPDSKIVEQRRKSSKKGQRDSITRNYSIFINVNFFATKLFLKILMFDI